MFEKYHVHYYTTQSVNKSNYAEAFIKTIRTKLFCIFQLNGSYNYTPHLQDVIEGYNKTVHSALGMPPNKVTKANEKQVFNHLYLKPTMYTKAFADTARKTSVKLKFKYKVGQNVNVTKAEECLPGHTTRP